MRLFKNPFRDREPREVVVLRDTGIIILSIITTIALVKTGALTALLDHSKNFQIFGAFMSGLFFTSVFTTAPAIAAFAHFGAEHAPLWLAVLGAAGALIGDLILFFFIRDSIAEDIAYILERRGGFHLHLFHIGKTRLSRWLLPALGALIIASPLPDELGIALMGFSKLSKGRFVLISFSFNLLGILIFMLLGRGMA
jgi:uncharacterized membrane protein YdjX (TVP38/TMEM64 family)